MNGTCGEGRMKAAVRKLLVTPEYQAAVEGAVKKWERVVEEFVARPDRVAPSFHSDCSLCDLCYCEVCPLFREYKSESCHPYWDRANDAVEVHNYREALRFARKLLALLKTYRREIG
jgi:hypothetical protein